MYRVHADVHNLVVANSDPLARIARLLDETFGNGFQPDDLALPNDERFFPVRRG